MNRGNAYSLPCGRGRKMFISGKIIWFFEL